MMFGPWGNDDQADSIRIIHRALDAGINFVDTADVYSGGVSEEIVGEALSGRRDDVVLATKFFMPMDDGPNHRGGSRRWIMRAVEDSLRRLGTDYIDLYQVHRPSPDDRCRGDPRRTHRPRPAGQGPLHRIVVVLGQPDRRGAVGRPRPPPRAVRHRAAAVLDPGPRHRGGCPAHRPAARHGHPDLQPARRWLAVGPVAQGRRRRRRPRRRGRRARFDMERRTTNASSTSSRSSRSSPSEAGMTLIELAIAFVINHPGVTSAIIGPRTMEQLESQLPAADVTLTSDVLDRIDAARRRPESRSIPTTTATAPPN